MALQVIQIFQAIRPHPQPLSKREGRSGNPTHPKLFRYSFKTFK